MKMLKLIDNKDDCGTVCTIWSHFTGKKLYVHEHAHKEKIQKDMS